MDCVNTGVPGMFFILLFLIARISSFDLTKELKNINDYSFLEGLKFHVPKECGSTINARNGTISSPGFPGHYPNNMKCQWSITSQTHAIMELRFQHFQLESCSDCGCDWVSIYDDFEYNKTLLGRHCGPSIPDVILSPKGRMLVDFRTDASYNFTGFTAKFTSQACISGWYGAECSFQCSENCLKSSNEPACSHVDGRCSSGCMAGFLGDKCDQTCISGRYGPNCGFTCSRNCIMGSNGPACNHVDGRCLIGCMAGFLGDKCDTTCISGRYGPNCGFTCSQNCIKSSNGPACNHVDGRCLIGCMVGFLGDKCDTTCISGLYGPNCGFTCSQNCIKSSNGSACNHIHGRCLIGCIDGFQGDKCDTTCISNRYGPNCGFTCSKNCIKSSNGPACNHIDGRCLIGCMPGFLGDNCDTICPVKTYGQGCADNCSKFCAKNSTNQRSCDHISGACVFGCVEGYKGPTCQEPCSDNTYGQGCADLCSLFCAENTTNPQRCHHIDGTCFFGCVEGYKSLTCQEQCQDNTYGEECATKCSQFCAKDFTNPQSCDHTSGACLFGCANGYMGHMCQERTACNSGSFGDQCQYKCKCVSGSCDADGSCESGVTCQRGWFGPACQYSDIAYNTSTAASHAVVVDGDDSTCLNGVNSTFINFDLGDQFFVTWIRIRLSKPELRTLFVSFGNNGTVECTTARNTTVDQFTIDLYCEMNQTTQYIRVSGDEMHSLCSLYVSGGRDISAGQNISMTSTFVGTIDVSTDVMSTHVMSTHVMSTHVESTSASRKKRDPSSSSAIQQIKGQPSVKLYNATWRVSFTRPYSINRVVLSNRRGRESYLLTEFKLQAFDEDGAETFVFEDNRRQMISFYSVGLISFIASTLSITVNNSENILQIWNVEIFGETVCEQDRFGRDCEHRCNCAGSESCFVSTGGCPSGCAAGFQGQQCRHACRDNTYGPGCTLNCSPFCVQSLPNPQSCHHVSGACFYGCISGFIGHNCQQQSYQAAADDKSSNLTAVWTVLAVICGLLVLIFIYVYMGRRRKHMDTIGLNHLNNQNRIGSVQSDYIMDYGKYYKERRLSESKKRSMTSEHCYESDYASLEDFEKDSRNCHHQYEKPTYEEHYDEIAERRDSEAPVSDIYDDTLCDSRIFNSTLSLEVNKQEHDTNVQKKNKTTQVFLEVGEKSSYSNMENLKQANHYENCIREKQQHCGTTTSAIYDDTLGPTQPDNTEISSSERNTEVSINRIEELSKTKDCNNGEYDVLEKCNSRDECSYPNIQDVQLLTDAPYEQFINIPQNNGANSSVIYVNTVSSTQPLNKKPSSADNNVEKMACAKVELKITDGVEKGNTLDESCCKNKQDVQQSSHETRAEII